MNGQDFSEIIQELEDFLKKNPYLFKQKVLPHPTMPTGSIRLDPATKCLQNSEVNKQIIQKIIGFPVLITSKNAWVLIISPEAQKVFEAQMRTKIAREIIEISLRNSSSSLNEHGDFVLNIDISKFITELGSTYTLASFEASAEASLVFPLDDPDWVDAIIETASELTRLQSKSRA